MENRGTDSIVEKRQLMRGVAQMLADALPVEQREAYLLAQVERINRFYPAPSLANMRSYLQANIVR